MKAINTSLAMRVMTLAVIVLPLGACANLDTTQQRMLSGAAIGAATGIAGTAVTGGCITCGAAIGTVAGAGAGYVIDQMNR